MLIIEQSGQESTCHAFDLRDRGLLLADGVFDTSLIVNGTMILRESHLERLVHDAAALDITIDHQRINDLLDKTLISTHNGAMRITVTSGPSEKWDWTSQAVDPTIILSLSPLSTNHQFQPIWLQTSRIRRNSTSPTSRHKTLAYTDHITALKIARTAGYHDALFLNHRENVCCATTGNLFFKFDDLWVTPPISDGVLPGVMRQWIIQNAPSIGLKVVERQIVENELLFAESAFMTNSVRLALPVQKLDQRELNSTLPEGLKYAVKVLTRQDRPTIRSKS